MDRLRQDTDGWVALSEMQHQWTIKTCGACHIVVAARQSCTYLAHGDL